MSEANTGAAVAAPVEATTAPDAVVETPVAVETVEAPAPQNKSEFKARMMEQLRTRGAAAERAAPAVPPGDAAEAVPEVPRGPDGRFVPKEGEAPAATEPLDSANTEAAAQPSVVRIEVPVDNPLRDQGLEFIDARPEQERAIRALLNNPVRRREVEEAQRSASELQAKAALAEAAADAWKERALAAFKDPNLALRYRELSNTPGYGPEAADRYMRGELQDMEQAVRSKQGEAEGRIAQERVTREVMAFEQQARESATRGYAPEITRLPGFSNAMQSALRQYGTALRMQEEAGVRVTLDQNDFSANYLGPALLMQPDVKGVVTEMYERRNAQERQQTAEQAKREAEAAAKAAREQELRDIADRRRTNHPLARISGAVQTGRDSTAQPEPDYTGMSHGQMKQEIKRQMFGRP